MSGTALTHRDYTVGWICALEIEKAAARASFDQEHTSLPSIDGDPNIYRFGCIAGHNVVIACLPDGETGNSPAATVATRMTVNFPSLKFGLMVGTGGGVPQPPNFDDIRLGDVVVSSAIGDIGGVVQYDRGKTVQDGNFKQTGSLNRPPEVLRQAVTDLRATYRLKRGRLAEYLAQIMLAHDTFTSPATTLGLQDTLFRSDYEHPKGSDFPSCDSCDVAQIVQRSPRSLNPVVHYGIIASGNQVMRNGLARDEISKNLGGVLCFEMEAAGLMNTFPCLVIRGICNYSDSHKNKAWQAYAAATAAAYTKELLGEIEPAKVDQSQAAAAVISESNAHWLVPFDKNQHFKLSSKDICQHVTIFELGGIGKTQIALEFAYRLRERSLRCAVFWVLAITTASFEQAYLEIAKLLQIPGITEQKVDVKRLVQSRLSDENFGEWLLIIDNADNIDILFTPSEGSNSSCLIDCLPVSPKGSIIFTTRTRKAAMKQAKSNDIIEVLQMDQAEAKKVLEKSLFQKHLFDEGEAVIKLLELLVYLPLAIVQAAAFINANGISIASYIALYENGEDEIIKLLSRDFEDQGRYRDLKNPIATTWLVSFNQIRLQNQLAADYLSFMSCLISQKIPESLLPPARSKIEMVEAIGTLTAYSFISRRQMEQLFDLHRLVYLATRSWLKNQSQLPIWADKALIRLASVVPAGGHEDRETWITYLPHAIHITSSLDTSSEKREVKINLLDKIGRCQHSIGQYKAAQGTHQRTLELRGWTLQELLA